MRALAVAALLCAACYRPAPPSGAYLCEEGTANGCPVGQTCECGLCVNDVKDAACAFRLLFSGGASEISVEEHQPFALTVEALNRSGAVAAGYNGPVELSANWGDVLPATLTLAAGRVSDMVTLNRETLPPSVATLTARFGDKSSGKSGRINVKAPAFAVEPKGIEAPFGWADQIVAQANVVRIGATFHMSFVGVSGLVVQQMGIGAATSTDGKTFTAAGAPILPMAMGQSSAQSPSLYTRPGKAYLALDNVLSGDTSRIILAEALNPTSTFTRLTQPAILATQCAYCERGVSFPHVIEDTSVPADENGLRPLVMFFAAERCATDACTGDVVAVGRATSTDGLNWTPEPAPVLSSDFTDEAVLISPRVLIDGTVWKMWYSFARLGNVPVGMPSLDVFCDSRAEIMVGYATSSDGFFWVRSPHNPVLRPGNPLQNIPPSSPNIPQGTRSILVSSVTPSDGINTSSGVVLHYSPFRRSGLNCLPSGVYRAVRP
jgi:hypothetical protein